jgi:hypothetical protein
MGRGGLRLGFWFYLSSILSPSPFGNLSAPGLVTPVFGRISHLGAPQTPISRETITTYARKKQGMSACIWPDP